MRLEEKWKGILYREFHVVKSRIYCKGGKEYFRVVVNVGDYDRYIIMPLHQWMKIVELYDRLMFFQKIAEEFVWKWRNKIYIEIEERKEELKKMSGEIDRLDDDVKKEACLYGFALLSKDIEFLERELERVDKVIERIRERRIE